MNFLSTKSKGHEACEVYADQSFQMAEDALSRMTDASDRLAEAIGSAHAQIDVLLERVARLEQRKHRLDEAISGINSALYADEVIEFPSLGPITDMDDLVVQEEGSQSAADGKSNDVAG